MHLGFSRADMIGEGEGAPPFLGSDWSFERTQQWLGVMIADRQHGDLQQIDHIFPIQSFRVFGGADTGGQRIARVDGHVQYRTSLHAVLIL